MSFFFSVDEPDDDNIEVVGLPNEQLKAIILSGTSDVVTKAEEAIRKLDVQAPLEKNIELLAYLVLASNETNSAPEPADLAPAIKQMQSLFQYKSYRLLDTIWMHTSEHDSIQSTGLLPLP